MPAKNEQRAPVFAFTSVRRMEAHLLREPVDSGGFWLKIAKAGAAERTITKDEAVAAALCCGWIDGQLAPFDDHHYLVRMTPRRARSRWSAKNRATAERLAKEGRLKPRGIAEVEAAKNDGRWAAAYASQASAQIPEDLAAGLARNSRAKKFFETLDRANRYSIIYRVNDAKRPETRAKRVRDFVEMLARGETIHPRKSARTTR